LKKLGLDYDSMKERFPELIYAQLTGYGQDGPDCDQPGYDSVAFYSRSGLLADTMEPGGYPPIPPGCVGDITTGTALFGGICAALLGRARTGKGDHIEVSLYGMALFACSTLVTFTQPQYNELYPKPRNQMKPMTTYYRCSDGEWITLTVLQPEKQFKGLCEALGIPEVGEDPRFQRRDDIILHKAELLPVLEEAFAKFSSSEITARLKEKNIVADRMRHFREQYKDPQALANDFMRPFTFESGNEAVMTMTPIKSANVGRVAFERGPLLGEDTDEILHTLHYSDEEIGRLKQEKVVK
jgi:crotonobetainyl-CoA:carnitine CoA-transferase CaiB-like acyl-CoA transferase